MPGSTHDLSAACTHGVFAVAARAELYLYADKGYVGGEGATLLTPYKVRNLPDSAREANRCQTTIRANAKRGFAVLKTWKIFDRFRGCSHHVGTFARAVLTLEHGPEYKEHGKSSLFEPIIDATVAAVEQFTPDLVMPAHSTHSRTGRA